MTGFTLSAAELHGLVDGFLEPERRADVLKRLSASPKDRARVEAWQEHADILRNAFGDVEREPLPAALNLLPLFQSGGTGETLSKEIGIGRGRRFAVAMAAGLTMASVAIGVWVMLDRSQDRADAPLRGTIDTTLANRALSALDADSITPHAISSDSGLPTSRIPDLESSGFALTAAEMQDGPPASLVFHYRSRSAEHVVLSVARADGLAETGPALVGETYRWHHRGKAFAIAGNVRPERLRDAALTLQRDGSSD